MIDPTNYPFPSPVVESFKETSLTDNQIKSCLEASLVTGLSPYYFAEELRRVEQEIKHAQFWNALTAAALDWQIEKQCTRTFNRFVLLAAIANVLLLIWMGL